MPPPGVAVGAPSVLVTPKSAWGVNTSVSVAVLLPGTGSVTPAGTDAVAVLESATVAVGVMVPVAVNVTTPDGGTVTAAEMFPDPLAGQVAPAPGTQVQVTPVSAAGNVSATVADPEAL